MEVPILRYNSNSYGWCEELPPSCPPKDSLPCDGKYYRMVKCNDITDFQSQRKLHPDKDFGVNIDECTARAVSVFRDIDDVKRLLKMPKFKKSKISELTLFPKDGLIKKTFSVSHYSWWISKEFKITQSKIY